MLVQAVIFLGFVSCGLFPHVKTFFTVYCFLDWSLMESGQEISVEKRALGRTIWSQIPRTSLSQFLPHCLSSYTSLTRHLPVKTITIEPLSFSRFLLLHALSTSSSPLLPASPPPTPRPDTGHARPATTLPVCLIKM